MAQNNLKTIAASALLFLLALFALSCASRPPAASTYPLLQKTVQTADGALSGRIPAGWNSASSDTLPSGVAAWLVSDDRAAFMVIREINLDQPASQRVLQGGLDLLARLSIALRSDSTRPAAAVPVQSSVLNNVSVRSYEMTSGGEWRNVIVLMMKGRCYECEANVAKGTPEVTRRVAEAQKAFCGSLTTSSRE